MYIQDSIIIILMALVNIGLMVLGAYTLWLWLNPWGFVLIATAFSAGTIYVNTIEIPTDFDE